MKKILSILLVMMLCMSIALAEAIDFKGMSTEELISLYQEIQAELSERIDLGTTNRIGRGSYVVGKDIKAGYYDFVCLDTDYFESGKPDNDIYIYLLDGDTAADLGERIYWE